MHVGETCVGGGKQGSAAYRIPVIQNTPPDCDDGHGEVKRGQPPILYGGVHHHITTMDKGRVNRVQPLIIKTNINVEATIIFW